MNYKKLWITLFIVIAGSLAVLGYFGWQIYQSEPPVPNRVVTTSGKVVFTGDEIRDGQNVWQSIGGQEVGTVWGHGAYVAPDWSADWLHRELVWTLDMMATAKFGKPYSQLDAPSQAALRAELTQDVRKNTYNPQTGDIVISDLRADAVADTAKHYDDLFGTSADLDKLRNAYAIPPNSVPDPERRKALTAFFFWTSWACATERPNEKVTYTQNWPAEDLIENRPSGQLIVWSVISFVLLLAGVADGMVARPLCRACCFRFGTKTSTVRCQLSVRLLARDCRWFARRSGSRRPPKSLVTT